MPKDGALVNHWGLHELLPYWLKILALASTDTQYMYFSCLADHEKGLLTCCFDGCNSYGSLKCVICCIGKMKSPIYPSVPLWPRPPRSSEGQLGVIIIVAMAFHFADYKSDRWNWIWVITMSYCQMWPGEVEIIHLWALFSLRIERLLMCY